MEAPLWEICALFREYGYRQSRMFDGQLARVLADQLTRKRCPTCGCRTPFIIRCTTCWKSPNGMYFYWAHGQLRHVQRERDLVLERMWEHQGLCDACYEGHNRWLYAYRRLQEGLRRRLGYRDYAF